MPIVANEVGRLYANRAGGEGRIVLSETFDETEPWPLQIDVVMDWIRTLQEHLEVLRELEAEDRSLEP